LSPPSPRSPARRAWFVLWPSPWPQLRANIEYKKSTPTTMTTMLGVYHLSSTHTFHQVASFSVASAATSVCGGGVGSRTSIGWSSPPAGLLVSSPSQERSMDFLHHTSHSVTHARLVTHVTTWEINKTYKIDRTTVTVGAPRMLVISQSQLPKLPRLPPGSPPTALAP
jgi:hypothetical protein